MKSIYNRIEFRTSTNFRTTCPAKGNTNPMSEHQPTDCELCIEAVKQGIGDPDYICQATEQRKIAWKTYSLCLECLDRIDERERHIMLILHVDTEA